MVLDSRAKRFLPALAGGLALALTLAACSSGDTGNGGGTDIGTGSGEGLEFGATKEEWIAAFADLDTIEIRTQSSSAKGAPSGKDFEDFIAEIEEYSGGKIVVDMGYSSAYAPPLEAMDALVDGRLDIAHVIPQYFPEEIPIAASLVNMNIVSNASPVLGAISSNVWPNQAGFESDLVDEFADLGMMPLVPYWNTGAGALICNSEHVNLSQTTGAVVAASGALQSEQVKAIGGSPTAMPFTEFYESLQRGAVDCVQTTGTSALTVGLPEVSPYAVIDPEASFIAGASVLSFGKDKWDSLPLLAQQLIWDRAGTFIAGNIVKVISNYNLYATELEAAGGGIYSFEEDARQAMLGAQPAILETIAGVAGDEFVSNAEALNEKWLQATADAGFDVDVSFTELQAWLDEGNEQAIFDYIQGEVFEEIYLPYRP